MKFSSSILLGHTATALYIGTREAALCSNNTLLGDFSLIDASVLKVPPIVDEAAQLVTFAVYPGTNLSNLSPTFCTASDTTSSPASGTTVDLLSNVTYHLTQPNSASLAWTFQAIEMASPALPGLYADPNIAVINSTFYIYPTTDGIPHWGGNTFYAWSSADLVSWTRSQNPILTLAGPQGNVPWANGNAWAPTIASRNGKYYLYFSGNNTALNTKTIGAAVASNPEGPWIAQPSPMILNNERLKANQAIDPAAFFDPVSQKYFLFWGNGNNPIVAELNDDMLSIAWDTAQNVTGLTNFREASFVNYRQGIYHYTYSVGDTRAANYSVGYATSTSLWGPYQYHGLILQQRPELGILATGSSSIIEIPGQDEWYIAYHRFAIPNGNGTDREVTIDRLEVGADGLFQAVVPTLSGVQPVRLGASSWSAWT